MTSQLAAALFVATSSPLRKMLTDSMGDVPKAAVGMELEAVGREVLTTYTTVVQPAYIRYIGMLDLNGEHPGSFVGDVLSGEVKNLREGVNALLRAARARLEYLETPIEVPPEPPKA